MPSSISLNRPFKTCSLQKVSETPDKFEIMSSVGKPLTVWVNPCSNDLEVMPELIRFTADYQTKNIYAWDFTLGHHSDVSVAFGLHDTFGSSDFLKGHARLNHKGLYEMVGSDFLESFKRKVPAADRAVLLELLQKDWTWLSGFMSELKWLDSFRPRFSLDRS